MQEFSQRPNVVPGKSQGFDFGQLVVIGTEGESQSKSLKCFIEGVHAIALAVICLHAAIALQLEDDGGTLRPGPGSVTPLLPSFAVRRLAGAVIVVVGEAGVVRAGDASLCQALHLVLVILHRGLRVVCLPVRCGRRDAIVG